MSVGIFLNLYMNYYNNKIWLGIDAIHFRLGVQGINSIRRRNKRLCTAIRLRYNYEDKLWLNV
jgi:hypothetical protein